MKAKNDRRFNFRTLRLMAAGDLDLFLNSQVSEVTLTGFCQALLAFS
jgi:hypothetical protein